MSLKSTGSVTAPTEDPSAPAIPAPTPTASQDQARLAPSDSEIPPANQEPPSVPFDISEPFYGDVSLDRVVLATRILDLPQPLFLTTLDATELLQQAKATLAGGNIAGPQVRADLMATLASLEVDGPPVDPEIDVAAVLATARSELELLATHHGIELPGSPAQLAIAAADLADLAGVPADLPLYVRLAMAQQRRVMDQAAARIAKSLGAPSAARTVDYLEDGHVLRVRVTMQGKDGPVRFWMIGLHPADPTVDIDASAPGRLQGTTAHAAQVGDAVVAINGGFWTSGADPDGLTVVDGLLVSDTSSGKTWVRNRRPAFGIDEGRAHAGLPTWTLAVGADQDSAAIPVRGFDRPINGPADLIVSLGAPVTAPAGTPSIAFDVLPDDLLHSSAETRTLANLAEPPVEGLVRVFVTGGDVGDHVEAVEVFVHIEVDAGFAGLDDVIAGGPTLLRGGAGVDVGVWRQEGFGPRHTDDRHPRTFAGVDRWGNVLLAVVDGRQPGWSIGLTQGETAEVVAALDMVNALQLDGGGSSTYVEAGGIMNRPSDGRQRPVATALVVIRRSS